MKKHDSPVLALVAAIVVVAVLCTVLVPGGWVVWLPVGVALGVTAQLWFGLTR